MFVVCLSFGTRQILVPLPCAMVFAHGKGPWSYIFFVYYVYGTPNNTSISYISQLSSHVISNKHRRHFILSKNAQMQINSSIVHRRPQVVHTSSCNSPYKFKSKGSTYVPANEVNTTQGGRRRRRRLRPRMLVRLLPNVRHPLRRRPQRRLRRRWGRHV